jgi:hypothetical protein
LRFNSNTFPNPNSSGNNTLIACKRRFNLLNITDYKTFEKLCWLALVCMALRFWTALFLLSFLREAPLRQLSGDLQYYCYCYHKGWPDVNFSRFLDKWPGSALFSCNTILFLLRKLSIWSCLEIRTQDKMGTYR